MKNLLYIVGGIFLVDLVLSPSAKSVGKISKYRFTEIYPEEGVTKLGFTKGKSGVYIIKENGKIVYVGQSSYDLYKTISRHFQEWNDRPTRISYRDRIKRNRYTVRVVFVSPTRATKLEEALIKKHMPRDNQEKINLAFEFPENPEAVEKVLEEYQGAWPDDVPF